MAGVKLEILAVAIMVIVGGAISAEAITCGQVNSALAPCLSFLKSGGTPTSTCCSGVATIAGAAKTTSDRQQACSCLKSAANGVGGIVPANAEALLLNVTLTFLTRSASTPTATASSEDGGGY